MNYLDAIASVLAYAPVVVGVVLFIFAYVQHFRDKLTPQTLKKCTWFAVLFFGLLVAAQIAVEYYARKNDPFAKLFLPPHQSIDWFAYKMLAQYVVPYAAALVAGLFMYFVALRTNAWSKRELFVENDKYVLLLAALIVGWPQYVLYLLLVVVLTVVQSLTVSAAKNDFGNRVILTNVLLLSIAGVLAFGPLVAQQVELWRLTIYA
ncbi:hypothetical protein A3C91_00260 [Candidatus Azambacteria bacterium RIFCSPHIGHO2_02_FULL_52_12]|uniref:Uncharacterized protein n=1 Tax=Candidatus Azambacteria bacterium RIFCSPLOWO2_01_FULL_46_25 TaxID=1797298 RepID=A0A1F5BUJ9_9BACT|nr:MAG: hypothetical protein A3C91_00260 [Candidatus Azambacteria bacterium RIFCSPHIGHO2_02_FULL_52_12]OGD34299.1 MAG: hypothetical protein A2988_02100 [Candidatus Azambacteria bacterium RIFCSPLOWO2_01_FULL_46_25]OGD37552.1 MAG: hypothetical protein A2850_00710 [Candidatus Azambacteria bacterium RIFCSPHIGHO2_01_FULL_51_74]